MKLPFLAVALYVAALATFAAQPSLAQNAFTPDQVKYGPAPPFLPPGAQLAVLEGDPMAASGDFTIRLKMPDGYKVPPTPIPTARTSRCSRALSKSVWEISSTPAR
jgi:hypothetical protein